MANSFLQKQFQLDNFHKTTFGKKKTISMLLFFIVWSLVSSTFLLVFIPQKDSLYIILSSVFTEIIPLTLIFSQRHISKQDTLVTFCKRIKINVLKWVGYFWKDIKNHYILLLCFALISWLLQNVPYFVLNTDTEETNVSFLNQGINQNFLVLLIIIFIGPLFEELFFRLILADVVTIFFNKKFNLRVSKYASFIITSTLFAISHGSDITVAEFMQYFLIGIFFQIIRNKTGSLTATTITHAEVNLFTFLFSFIG